MLWNKQGFSLASSCFVCGFQLCHIPSLNNKQIPHFDNKADATTSWYSRQEKKSQAFWFISVACHPSEGKHHQLTPKPVTEGNHSLVVQEEAWKDFLLLLKDSKATAILMLDLWKANNHSPNPQTNMATLSASWKTFSLQVMSGLYSCTFE